jgi:glucose/arabinose dehydrogenase
VTAGLLLALAGCGGGSGGGGGGGETNAPPVFTSPAEVAVAENTTGTIYTAAAGDPDGDTLRFSLAAGADAALFAIVPATGALSFRTPPDFDTPRDADRNNVYEATLSVSDGRASASLPLRVTVTDVAADGFAVRRVGTGFAAPLFLTALPDNSGRVLVVERGGRIRLLDPASGAIAPTPFLDLRGEVATDGERGLLAVALAPDYMASGQAYVFLTAPDGTIELRRYTASGAGRTALDPASGDVLLAIAHPRNNHNGGWLGFDAAGLLYMATGDGGGANDPDGNAQDRFALLGKMLRLDVSRDDFPSDPRRDYAVPPANPFAGTGAGAGEVWLYGLRNPYRNSFDRMTGELWIGDVGQGAIEEIDRVLTRQAGLNMGWPLFEGTQMLSGSSPAGITMPVTQYSHGSGALQGNAVTGGVIYRGPVEALQGLYVFADFISGNVWTVPAASLPRGATQPAGVLTNRNAAFAPDAGTLENVTGFGEDQQGNLFIVTIGGDVFMIRPA